MTAHKSVLTILLRWLYKQIWVTLICIHKWKCNKTFQVEVLIFQKFFFVLGLFWAKNKKLHVFWEKLYIYGLVFHIFFILGHRACKCQRKSEKSCLLEKVLLVILFQNCFPKSKNIKTGRNNVLLLKICQAWSLQF